MTNAQILLYPGPRAHAVPIPDAPAVVIAIRRRRTWPRLAIRYALAVLIGIIAGIVLPAIALILSGYAFLAAIGV